MNKKSLMSILEFSNLTGIRRANLRFYDKAGLLSPKVRGENGYRYYTSHQLNTAFLISALRAIDVSLDEIHQYAQERSPEKMLELYKTQDKRIQAEIERLQSLREIMRINVSLAKEALQYTKNTVILEEKKRQPIFLCQSLPTDILDEEALASSYEYAADQGINISFPVGGVINRENLEIHNWEYINQHYFKINKKHNTYKPAGTYAVCYGEWIDRDANHMYTQLMDYIKENHLKIVGDAYEEYLLDELCIPENEKYGIRIEIPVEKENTTQNKTSKVE